MLKRGSERETGEEPEGRRLVDLWLKGSRPGMAFRWKELH